MNPFQWFFDFLGQMFTPVPQGQPSKHDGGRLEWDLLRGNEIHVMNDRNPEKAPIPVDPSSFQAQARSQEAPILKPSPPRDPANTVPRKYTGGAGAKPGTWTQTNKFWLGLSEHERVAAMAMMEVNKKDDVEAARNVSAAIVNRARQRGFDLGKHVSSKTYQPTFEPAQERALPELVKTRAYQDVLSWVKRYDAGQEDDPTNGSTHYIAHAKSMYKLYKKNPSKYPIKNWGGWSNFDIDLMDYRGKLAQDKSHAFMAPDPIGRFSVGRAEKIQDRLPTEVAGNLDQPINVKTVKIDPNTGDIKE